MKKKKDKGVISLWILGILTTITMSYAGLTTTTLFQHSKTNAEQDSRISVNEANIISIEKLVEDIKDGNEQIINILMER